MGSTENVKNIINTSYKPSSEGFLIDIHLASQRILTWHDQETASLKGRCDKMEDLNIMADNAVAEYKKHNADLKQTIESLQAEVLRLAVLSQDRNEQIRKSILLASEQEDVIAKLQSLLTASEKLNKELEEENARLRKIADDFALINISLKDGINDVLKEYIENVNDSDNITETLEELLK